MSTDISMQTRAYQVDDRRWLLAEPDVKMNRTLDPTKFTAGTHYPNGYLPSGTVIGKVTATGLYGPYDAAATDGTQVADSLTYGSATFIRQDGTTAPKVGISAVLYDTVVSVSKLPFPTGSGTKGALDGTSNTGTVTAAASLTAAKAALNTIRWEA